MRARLSAAAVVGLLLSACGGGAAPPAVAAAVDTLNGVERLSYPAESSAHLAWGADTVAVIGDVFGEDAYQFGEVSANGLDGDADGNLYVLDRQAYRVLKYGPDGKHLATYGRKGGGPGELEQPIDMELGPGDSIWVADFSNSRFTVLPQEGGEARSIRFPENTFPMYGFSIDDDFYAIGSRVLRFTVGPGGGRATPPSPGIPVLAFGRDGTLRDTLWQAPEPKMDRVELTSGNNVMVAMSPRAFAPRLRFDMFSDGTLAVNDSAAYLVALVAPDGTVEHWIQRDPPPRPTTEADREAERDRVRAEQANNGGGVAIRVGGGDAPDRDPLLEQRLQKMTFEEVIPRIVRLAVDPHDRLWVGVSEATPGEVERIDVYDRDGALLGELRGMPFPDVFMGQDRFGTLVQDDLDVQQVVVYRLSGAARMASGT